MADTPTFKTVDEKYEYFLAQKVRLQRGNTWATNPAMTETSGIPILVQVSERELKTPGSALQKQGYVRFTPKAKVEAPVEAKKVETPKA